MKNRKMIWLIAPVMLFQVACKESQEEKMEDQIDSTTTRVENAIDNAQDELQDYRDEVFLENVYEENKEELLLINLAMTKGSSDKVKSTAKKMKADHEALDKTLIAYAAKNNIELGNKSVSDNLEGQDAGTGWDEEWVRKMKDTHEKVIRKFERKQDNVNNAELGTVVNKTLPVLNDHMGMLNTL